MLCILKSGVRLNLEIKKQLAKIIFVFTIGHVSRKTLLTDIIKMQFLYFSFNFLASFNYTWNAKTFFDPQLQFIMNRNILKCHIFASILML